MCLNRKFTPEQQQMINQMRDCAKSIISGESIERVAEDMQLSVQEVKELIEQIKDINEFLYNQVMAKLA